MFIPPSLTPPVTVPPRHVREMQKRVEQLVREFRRESPELTDAQIREALRLALGGPPATDRRVSLRRATAVGLAVALAMGAALGGVVSRGDAGSARNLAAPLAVAVIAAVLAVVFAIRLRGDR